MHQDPSAVVAVELVILPDDWSITPDWPGNATESVCSPGDNVREQSGRSTWGIVQASSGDADCHTEA